LCCAPLKAAVLVLQKAHKRKWVWAATTKVVVYDIVVSFAGIYCAVMLASFSNLDCTKLFTYNNCKMFKAYRPWTCGALVTTEWNV
jgi:hypothetical protein